MLCVHLCLDSQRVDSDYHLELWITSVCSVSLWQDAFQSVLTTRSRRQAGRPNSAPSTATCAISGHFEDCPGRQETLQGRPPAGIEDFIFVTPAAPRPVVELNRPSVYSSTNTKSSYTLNYVNCNSFRPRSVAKPIRLASWQYHTFNTGDTSL